LVLFWGLGATTLKADDVVVAVSLAKPPYVLEKEKAGIEYDIVREALAYKGHRLIPKFMPQRRILHEYQRGLVEGIFSVRPFSDLKGFVSASTISYQNFAVTLDLNKFKISSLADLAGKTIIAFQNAKHFLGPEFVAAMEQTASYMEARDQFSQVKMLFTERAEVAIADKAIIQYFARQVPMERRAGKNLVFHKIFEPSKYHSAFWDKQIRDDFNEGLRHLRETGRYDEIFRKYL